MIEGEDDKNEKVIIVRVFVSYDMGWSKRGNGHTFDSPNGSCCVIGVQCGRVIAFKTFNRLCKTCNEIKKSGIMKKHDCRRNHFGSAKSMEGQGAKALAQDPILKKANIQIGGFVGDDDSQSLQAIQSVSDFTILKQSDMSHTKRNIKNILYDIKKTKTRDPASELTHDSIKKLVKNFAYAVQQNKGELENMTQAIKNIPLHVTGFHQNCGKWCQADKENHEPSIRLRNMVLIQEITNLFENLSKNANKFLTAGSSQPNESVFNTLASKAPKRIDYSSSASSDYRFAAVVAQKKLLRALRLKGHG